MIILTKLCQTFKTTRKRLILLLKKQTWTPYARSCSGKDVPKNIKASCNVESTAKTIMVDGTLLKRILGNLVSNAVQAMPNGGELTMRAHQEANEVVIAVKDTGIGIPDKVKPKLFTPLFTTKSKGQGLGLAVVKRMVEALNGTVTFESIEGNGTTFIIRFPLNKRHI